MPRAAGNVGRPDSTRLTFETMPGVRMLPARQRSVGPTATGSTRPVSVRFGSIALTTACASISSPPASTTPVARPSRERTARPRRPSGSRRRRRGLQQPARWSARQDRPRRRRWARRPAVVAGRDPRAGPQRCSPTTGPSRCMPAPRQAERGLQGIGLECLGHEVGDGHRQDAQHGPPVVPAEARKRRPSASPSSASPSPGASMSGGGLAPSSARNRPIERTCRSNSTYARRRAPSVRRSRRRLSSTSADSVIAVPSGEGAKARTCGDTSASRGS